ncbi:hypothetical protein C8034_v009428 [Colletotrichum sidae]|uniref:Uncharacterized protein n=1 Tax=Colletotrichum sidae TaxID=1347389 RepID=A0A4R8T1X1_9PEZI|nr:hypothetical protein C8034_v009428 [Colletotrichum sidae]
MAVYYPYGVRIVAKYLMGIPRASWDSGVSVIIRNPARTARHSTWCWLLVRLLVAAAAVAAVAAAAADDESHEL